MSFVLLSKRRDIYSTCGRVLNWLLFLSSITISWKKLSLSIARNIKGKLILFYVSNAFLFFSSIYLFDDGGPCYIETSTLICYANQWTGFYIIVAFVMKELRDNKFPARYRHLEITIRNILFQRRIQIPAKHLRWSVLQKQLTIKSR